MRRLLPMSVPAAALILGASPLAAADPQDCFENLMRGRSAQFRCTLPLAPSAAERADLEKVSRGYLKDVACTVTIDIARADLDALIERPDHVFQAGKQPVACEVTADWRGEITRLPIKATFAPKVVMKDGKAIDAVPGLGDVEGVPRALSWPVEAWVNSGIGIKGNMLKVIDAWVAHMRATSPRRQAQR